MTPFQTTFIPQSRVSSFLQASLQWAARIIALPKIAGKAVLHRVCIRATLPDCKYKQTVFDFSLTVTLNDRKNPDCRRRC
jgi:hypothetical protein